MPNNNPQSQQPVTARLNEKVEQGTQRIEQGVQSATEAAIEKVRDVRERAETGIEEQRGMVADRVRRFSDVLRHTSNQLTREDQFAQSLLDNASERVNRVADYIERVQPDEVLDDVQSFARRQPAVFFGGAFIIGLALGRFAKSSSSALRASSSNYYEGREQQGTRSRAYGEPTRGGAQRAPGYELSESTQTQTGQTQSAQTQTPTQTQTQPQTSQTQARNQAPATSRETGSAGSVGYGASTAGEAPKPQTSEASSTPRTTEPGQGTKS